LLVPPKPPVPRDEPDMPDPEEPEDPDMPDPEDPDEPDWPDEPGDFEEPDELEKPDELLLGELGEALRSLWPMPERLVSPASSSDADGDRLPLDALRELPSPTDASSRMSRCDDEPDWPCRPDEPDCGSPCEPDRPDDPLIPPWFTFDEPEFLSRSVMWRTSF
jgi:hypothetical protein